jgi:hypothetical protein
LIDEYWYRIITQILTLPEWRIVQRYRVKKQPEIGKTNSVFNESEKQIIFMTERVIVLFSAISTQSYVSDQKDDIISVWLDKAERINDEVEYFCD